MRIAIYIYLSIYLYVYICVCVAVCGYACAYLVNFASEFVCWCSSEITVQYINSVLVYQSLCATLRCAGCYCRHRIKDGSHAGYRRSNRTKPKWNGSSLTLNLFLGVCEYIFYIFLLIFLYFFSHRNIEVTLNSRKTDLTKLYNFSIFFFALRPFVLRFYKDGGFAFHRNLNLLRIEISIIILDL